MKSFKVPALAAGACLLFGFFAVLGQQPSSQSSETVAKPRKKDSQPAEADEPKIPSKFSKKDKEIPEGVATFKSDVTSVQLDVSVLDNKGRFIPKIPGGNFRILEDDVPQKVATFSTGNEAPMTVSMVIEFSNLFQQYWTEGWYETLVAA